MTTTDPTTDPVTKLPSVLNVTLSGLSATYSTDLVDAKGVTTHAGLVNNFNLNPFGSFRNPVRPEVAGSSVENPVVVAAEAKLKATVEQGICDYLQAVARELIAPTA